VVRSIYGARPADQFGGTNVSFTSAANISAQINPISLTAVENNLDLTSATQPEYFTFAAPQNTTGTLQLTVQSAQLSLLRQAVTVYAADQVTVLGSASSAGAYNGTTDTITISGVAPGQVFYVKVAGADTTMFGTGEYGMTLNFGSGPNASLQLPNTQVLNGSPLQGGGSQTQTTPVLNNFNLLPGVETLGVGHLHHGHSTGHQPKHHHPAAHHPVTHHSHGVSDHIVDSMLSDHGLASGLSSGRGG
jgi:hypothetical protein